MIGFIYIAIACGMPGYPYYYPPEPTTSTTKMTTTTAKLSTSPDTTKFEATTTTWPETTTDTSTFDTTTTTWTDETITDSSTFDTTTATWYDETTTDSTTLDTYTTITLPGDKINGSSTIGSATRTSPGDSVNPAVGSATRTSPGGSINGAPAFGSASRTSPGDNINGSNAFGSANRTSPGFNINVTHVNGSATRTLPGDSLNATSVYGSACASPGYNVDDIRTTDTTTRTSPGIDLKVLLDIIANLTYDYETNLTRRLNETLAGMRIDACGGGDRVTTTVESTTSELSQDYSGFNRTIIAKCFVCGLESKGIPYDANCADAFAGDFLPLVPQDPRARAQIARYKKYCRYGDVCPLRDADYTNRTNTVPDILRQHKCVGEGRYMTIEWVLEQEYYWANDTFYLMFFRNYFKNASQPRSLYGRWTGGCSVRWADLTGVFTQRTCRNRRRATTGLHYASKRMARLEMAIHRKDDGCIISPVATLLPLSRGISLFARFHACVCTGDWCNISEETKPSTFSSICAILAVLLARRLVS